MFGEFLRFDLRFQWRTPLLWVGMAVFALLAFGATSSDAVQVGGSIGNVHRNAPYVIVRFLSVFTVLGMFLSGAFVGGTLLRDFEMGTSELFFSKPIDKRSYLCGRFTAGVIVSLTIYISVALGMMLGGQMPWLDAARLGPFSLSPYLYGFAVFVIPNLVFSSALIMLCAALTRSMLGVYLAIMAFLVLWGVGGFYASDLDNLWVSALVDPFGGRALELSTRYWSAEERNTRLPFTAAYILANRALWSLIALLVISATLALFKPQRLATQTRKSWLFSRRRAARPQASVMTPGVAGERLATAPGRSRLPLSVYQYLEQTRFDTRHVLFSVPFLIMVGFGLVNLFFSLSASTPMYDTPLYPVTAQMLRSVDSAYAWILIFIVMFYAGELMWRERSEKLDGVVDAFPVPSWVPLAAKATTLVAVTAAFMLAAALCCMTYQLFHGYTQFELSLYAKSLALTSTTFILTGWLALAFQVLSHHKVIGYLLTIAIFVSWITLDSLDLDHKLLSFATAPPIPYSDMNGFGHLLKGWGWYMGYWALFTLSALGIASAFWVRGSPAPFRARVRQAKEQLMGGRGLLLLGNLLLTVMVGAWVLYSTTVLNTYRASDTQLDVRAAYEKRWRKTETLAQPRIIAADNDVQIYPAERRTTIAGKYRLKNVTQEPIRSLQVLVNPDIKRVTLRVPGGKLKEHDVVHGVRVYALDAPMLPGAELDFGFEIDLTQLGFTNGGEPGRIHHNGTFFDNFAYFPLFGYQRDTEITDRNERRKRGLGAPRRMPKLEAPMRSSNYLSDDADWLAFKSTVCTSPDQIAMAPGYLRREWRENGRRCFRYEMDAPILGFWAYLSADWRVKKDHWQDVAIEIYYDRKHPYNVDRMIEASKQSLSYFTTHFGPYQHRQFRILEFPRYANFAQAFPNTIPYSESIGFIANVDAEDAVDYVFYVTAHELAHQWWGHQVIGANAQGSTLMSETLAQYSALMVMERRYGASRMRKFLKYELDSYLRGRGGEIIEELPLNKVESSQGYVHYNKGSLVMYRLKDELGADVINLALRNYLAKTKYQPPPYTISTELIAELRAVAPKDKQELISDLFERIVFYDNRAEAVTARKLDNGKYEVTIAWSAAKIASDGLGKERTLAINESMDIAIFARGASAKEEDEKVLYLKKHEISAPAGKVTVIVDELPYEAGIDPLNKLIDRVSNDNRKRVTVEG